MREPPTLGAWGRVRLAVRRLRQPGLREVRPLVPSGTSVSHTQATGGKASIVIPVVNLWEYTALCLDSIAAFTDWPYEIVVVDNGSTDRTAKGLRERPGVKAVRNDVNQGFAAACNQGWRAARGPYVVFLNNDTLLTPGWLRNLIVPLERDPTLALVGACTNFARGDQAIPEAKGLRPEACLQFAEKWCDAHAGELQRVDALVAFCLAARRSVLEAVGGFDVAFGIGNYEDDDLCQRVRQAGFGCAIARDSFVYHFGRRTFESLRIDYWKLLEANRARFRSKWQDNSDAQ